MIAHFLCAHLVGDFLLQNHWMQRKSQSWFVCTVHVALYALPFAWLALPVWALFLILLEHWVQDRYALHLRWMKLYGHSTPEQWPLGPLCIDQAMHIAWLWLISALL